MQFNRAKSGAPAQLASQAQQATLDQRIGRQNRGFGQAGALSQLAVAERGFAMAKGLQHGQAVSQRGGENQGRVAAAQGRSWSPTRVEIPR